ncbi:hypothetical protein CDD83_4680 [Cordyceps sp. RAO-2017]|nr:hypothetical protein CDD83_4680 [Cordyceps sp. RAO-2017]
MSREAAARGGPGPELEARAPAPAGAPSRDSEAGDAAPGEGDVPGADADKAPDVNEVRWDQLEDRENPRCWPARRKWTVVFSVSLFTFISPIASSMIAPDLAAIAQELGIASQVERSLVLSVFVAAYALGPLLWAPLSEVYGRAVVLQAANGLFLCFNLGCGLARTEAQLLACRFVSAAAPSASTR